MNRIPQAVSGLIEDARKDPDAFWARAAQELPWFKTWGRVFEWTPPTFRWFVGGETNVSYNAVDHHVLAGRGEHPALIYFNEHGETRRYTYAELLGEVKRTAAALRGLGIRKGDRITVYMPTAAEAIILMLATARIGAIHSVVFGGFATEEHDDMGARGRVSHCKQGNR